MPVTQMAFHSTTTCEDSMRLLMFVVCLSLPRQQTPEEEQRNEVFRL